MMKYIDFRKALLALAVVSLVACSGAGQDQTVADYPIAYVKRLIPTMTDIDTGILMPVDPDIREATAFNAGGDIYLRDRASPSASERNLTRCITAGLGDVKDLETSYDGIKLIFSLRLEDTSNGNDVPKWNIFEYDMVLGGCPTRVIQDDFAAAKGDDVAPHYLPDGRIVFSSSAGVTTREILLNEGKSQFSLMDEELNEFAVLLHVMDADGTDIRQISFNQSHDLDASVLSSGEIVFSRWDGARGKSAIRLYTVHPDGTELKALYGLHEANVGTGGSVVQFLAPRELDDGRVLAMLKPFTGSAAGGAPVRINSAGFADINQPTVPNLGILSGPGQVLAINQDVRTDGSISPAGRYRSVYPLRDGSNRALVSWSQCRLQPTDSMGVPLEELPIPCPDSIPATALEAFPLYGVYVYDFSENTQLPVVIPVEGLIIDEPVVLAPRPRPVMLLDKVVGLELDQTLAEVELVGILHIRSVYDFDGSYSDYGSGVPSLAAMSNPEMTNADVRPARYLRIVKAAAIPDPNDNDTAFDVGVAFGAGGRRGGMREIIGYAPIEPDGSVMVKVPANTPLAISVVDKEGRRVSGFDSDGRRIGERHLNWIQVRPGETLECGGCHDHNPAQPVPAPVTPLLAVPHGYRDAPTALNAGAPTAPYTFPGTNGEFIGQIGETMAQARIRTRCTNASSVFVKTAENCPELSPNPNPVFFDRWAMPADEIPDDIGLRYAALDVLMAAGIPVPASCIPGGGVDAEWDHTCRTVINYETSIHPLWGLPRTDIATQTLDRTCVTCHTGFDEVGMVYRVPDAQLDLRGIASNEDPDVFMSYRELLFTDFEDEVNVTGTGLTPVLVDQIVQDTDPVTGELLFETDPETGELLLDVNGDPIPILVTIQVMVAIPGRSLSVNGARASDPRFFNRFNAAGDVHEGLLTPSEIRLLSEWLDIGAQYFNNSFDAP